MESVTVSVLFITHNTFLYFTIKNLLANLNELKLIGKFQVLQKKKMIFSKQINCREKRGKEMCLLSNES